jgi:hypothetical protein
MMFEQNLNSLYSQKLSFMQFKMNMAKLYPQTWVVGPNEIVTAECRGDMSRFFPKFDDDGLVVGGGFG